jgi:hypothetical protein
VPDAKARPQRTHSLIPVIPDPAASVPLPTRIGAVPKMNSLPAFTEPVKPNQPTALDMDLVVQALLATQGIHWI